MYVILVLFFLQYFIWFALQKGEVILVIMGWAQVGSES